MLSTASMVGADKVFGNLMVDVQLSNEKLIGRAKRIVMEVTECDYETAEKFLELPDRRSKIARVIILTEVALEKLEAGNGFIRQIV